MILLQLAVSLGAALYGIYACKKGRQPLFFKILCYAMLSYFMGNLFKAGYFLVYQTAPAGFHIGVLGHIGTYFFLISSYYGAIDSLLDNEEPGYNRYRYLSLAAPVIPLGMACFSYGRTGFFQWLAFFLIAVPMALTMYFAMKHLIFPDIELGIVRVMRHYNICVLVFCSFDACAHVPLWGEKVSNIFLAMSMIPFVFMIPLARKGVAKWFI